MSYYESNLMGSKGPRKMTVIYLYLYIYIYISNIKNPNKIGYIT